MMERPVFKLTRLITLAVSAVIVGVIAGSVVGGLTENPPAGWTFFALTLSHVVAGGAAIMLTHDVE